MGMADHHRLPLARRHRRSSLSAHTHPYAPNWASRRGQEQGNGTNLPPPDSGRADQRVHAGCVKITVEHHEAAAQGPMTEFWNPTGPAAAVEEGRSVGRTGANWPLLPLPGGPDRQEPSGRSLGAAILCALCAPYTRGLVMTEATPAPAG